MSIGKAGEHIVTKVSKVNALRKEGSNDTEKSREIKTGQSLWDLATRRSKEGDLGESRIVATEER